MSCGARCSAIALALDRSTSCRIYKSRPCTTLGISLHRPLLHPIAGQRQPQCRQRQHSRHGIPPNPRFEDSLEALHMKADNPTILPAITPVLASSFPKLVLPRENTRHGCHRRCPSARCRQPIVLPSSNQSTVEHPCISLASAGNVVPARVLFVAIVHAASSKNKNHLLLNAVDGFYANV